MKRIDLFRGEDGREFEVPEDEQEAFTQEMQDIPVTRIEKYRGEDGREFDVPEQERDAFLQEMQGLKVDRIHTVKAGDDMYDVPESEAQGFAEFYRNDPRFQKEREEKALGIAKKFDDPGSPIWAGVKAFFSPTNYADNFSVAGASASAANVIRGVAQAPATIADKGAAALQLASRIRDVPMELADKALSPIINTFDSSGMVSEALFGLKQNKAYREMLAKGREYVDQKKEEFVGFRNAKGERATAADLDVTLGGQAANSVAEAYLLSAPGALKNVNELIREGAEKAMPKLVAKLAPSVQTMLYGASTAEDTAEKAQAKGYTQAEAVGLGLLTGTIESALESVSQVFGLQDAMTREAMKDTLGKMILKKVMGTAGEGLTEGTQEFQKAAIEKISKVDEKTWGQIGAQSAQATALGLVSGGAAETASGIFGGRKAEITPAPPITDNTGGSDEQVRMEQEAQASGEGERAQRESVLEGETAQGEAGEGAQPAAMDQPGQDTGGGVRVDGQAQGPARTEPLQIAEGVFAEPMDERFAKTLPGSVKIRLASGKQIYSNDPGLAALVEYWYKDRVLFPPAPAGDTGRQDGAKQITDGGSQDVALNASRRAGFQVKPAKRVLINIGRSKDSYRGTIVQILDGQTVRVKIDKTQRSLKNSRAGYADVDVRQLAQFANVVGKQNYLDLMKGMTDEQKKKVEADAKAFKNELIDVGLFLDQDAWTYVDGLKGSKARTTKDELIADAYARASAMMGIPLDNHIQRAQALPILQEFHARMQGSEGLPYDAYAERAAREGEQDMADRRASGEFSLADLTPEEMAQADARLEAQRIAAATRRQVMQRASELIRGNAGELTGIIPGMEDIAEDDTPLFGVRNEQSPIDNGSVDTGEELPFNMAPERNGLPRTDGSVKLSSDEKETQQSEAQAQGDRYGLKDQELSDQQRAEFVPISYNRRAPLDGRHSKVVSTFISSRKPVRISAQEAADIDKASDLFYAHMYELEERADNGEYVERYAEEEIPHASRAGKLRTPFKVFIASEEPLYNIKFFEYLDKINQELTDRLVNEAFVQWTPQTPESLRIAEQTVQIENGDLENDTSFLDETSTRYDQGDMELFNVAPEAAGVYNQDSSGGADTPRAQEQAAQKTPINTPPWMQERNAVGMDLMDAVGMVYQLTGKFPKVMEKLRRTRALGYFDPNTKEIVLWAKIFGLVDDQDRARITKALKDKGFEGEKLFAQEAIEVKALMEKRRKEHQKRPLKVAVHELAHLVDFLPDNTIRRGNILGHVAALKKHLKQAIGPELGAQGPLTEKEKSDLSRRAEREMKDLLGEARTVIEEVIREVPEYKILGITPDDVKGLLGMDSRTATPELYDWFTRQESDVKRDVLKAAMQGVVDERTAEFANKQQVGTRTVIERIQREVPGYTKEAGRKRFRELLAEEAQRRRLIEIKRIKEEARNIIPWWRGVESMEQYFEKPEEMYAELMGIFLADPSELQRRAPTVHRAFMGWMDARPEVAESYRAFLDARNMPDDKQAAIKIEALKRGMTAEDEAARREADEMARKPGKWANKDSFLYFFHRKSAPIKGALDRSLKTLLSATSSESEQARLKAIYDSARVGIKRQSAVGRVIQQYEMEVNERVAKPLDRMGLDMLDLGVYQALRRVVYELDGKAAPAGVEPASALKLLTAIEEQYGPEKWKAFQDLAMEFRQIREQRIIQNPDLRAMFDKELLEKLDNNVEYVTFKHVPTMQQIREFKDAIRKAKSGNKLLREDVAEFLTGELDNRLGSSVGAKIHRYVGSFGPVANPIVATLSKDEQLIKSATRNTLRKKVYEFVKESGLDLIRDVQYERNVRGMMVPKMIDDANWKTVVYMEDGQVKGYLANRWLAKSLETGISEDVVALNMALRANSMITKLYTQLKYTFSFMNNIRDVERAANYIPGMERMRLAPGVNVNVLPFGGFISTLQRYDSIAKPLKKIFPKLYNDRMIEFYLADARRAAIMIQDGTINQEEERAREMIRSGDLQAGEGLLDAVRLAREGLAKPILMSHMEAIREDSTMDDYSRRLYRLGIKKDDVAKGLNLAAHIMGMFKSGARTVEGWGEIGELTTKLATWKYLQNYGQNMSEDQKILMTRELGGSPDFSERGRAASYMEFITSPFVNAAKEGTIGSLQALKERPGETTAKLFKNVVAPTMIRNMLSTGLALALLKLYFGDDEEKKAKSWMYNFAEWYYERTKNVPNYVLKNYHAYPLPFSGLEESNFTLMLRSPMDQTSQMLSLATWNLMDTIGEHVLEAFNDNGTPVILSRTERPGIETAKAFVSSVGPDALGQAPVLGMLGLLYGFFSGENYFDDFKGVDVFDENELIARYSQPNAVETLASEVSNRMGGTMIKRWNKDNIWGETPPTLHQWLNMPIVQPLVGSFLNVHTGGQAQMERKLGRIKKEFEAPIKVEAKNDFAQALREGGGGSLKITDEMISKMLPGDTYESTIKSQIYKDEFESLQSRYYNKEMQRGEIGELMKLGKEKNPLMQSIRMDIMDRNRSPSPMETNSGLMEDGRGR
jgi:hypothetical protein